MATDNSFLMKIPSVEIRCLDRRLYDPPDPYLRRATRAPLPAASPARPDDPDVVDLVGERARRARDPRS